MHPAHHQSPLERFFSGITEFAFQARLGVADPPLVEYVAALLLRFVHAEEIYRVRNLSGGRIDEVAQMLVEANERIGGPRREVHRHIGDFTLFWTGVYPEALMRLQNTSRRDHLLDYCTEGKRAYYIASTIPVEDESAADNAVLERLSQNFELCAQGLAEARREWERRDDEEGDAPRPIWIK